jgi:hypothetical protein
VNEGFDDLFVDLVVHLLDVIDEGGMLRVCCSFWCRSCTGESIRTQEAPPSCRRNLYYCFCNPEPP